MRLSVASVLIALVVTLVAADVSLPPASSPAALAAPAHAAGGSIPTVFGLGAELHLLPLGAPDYGLHIANVTHAGSKVRVVGLGFHPGTRVHVIYGVPNAEYVPQPIASARVGPGGRFVTTMTVTRAMIRNLGPGHAPNGMLPLLIQAYEGATVGLGAGHAYAVAGLLVFAP